ncbi:MAG: hypothetical protein ACK56J_02585 [Planctomycetota bacterium]|jgi:hypothetical protein
MRNWSSSDGKFTREGELVEIVGEQIRLELADGKSILVQAGRLSPSDQEFILAEFNRMMEDFSSPFLDEDPSRAFPSGKELDLVFDFARVPDLELNPDLAPTLNPEDWLTAPTKKPKEFRLPAFSLSSRVTGYSASLSGKMFGISIADPRGLDPNATNRKGARRDDSGSKSEAQEMIKAWVDIVDLETAKTRARWPLVSEGEFLGDVADSGNLIVTYGGLFAEDKSIRVLSVTKQGLVLQKSWPYDRFGNFDDRVNAVGFLSDQRLLVDYYDYLLVLQLDPVQPLFKIPKDGVDWQISRDRTKAVVERLGKSFLFDLLQGKCLGIVDGAASELGSRSPDGARFARFGDSVLTLRDANGRQLDEFDCPIFERNVDVKWIDERTLFLQAPTQQYFIDVDRRVVFLEVVNGFSMPPSRGGWLVGKFTDSKSLFFQVAQVVSQNSFRPDHAEYQSVLPADADSLLIFQPGSSLKITMRLTADPSQESAVRQQLEELLEQRGVKVDPAAANELRVSSQVRNEEVVYRSLTAETYMSPDAAKTVKVKLIDQQVELLLDGQVVWQRASTSGPGFVLEIREDETAQQAADRETGNGSGFWAALALPRSIARHPKGQAWTRLMLTPEGYKPVR